MDFLTDRLSEQYGSFPEAVIFLYAGQILYSNEAGQALLKKEDFPQDLLPALAEHPGGMEIALGKTFYFVTVSQLQEGDLLVLRDLDPPPEKKHPFSNAVYRMRECLSNLSATQWKMQQVLEDNGLLDGLEQDLANQNRLVFQMLRLTRQAELTQELNYKSFPREEGFDLAMVCQGMADEATWLADLAGVRFSYSTNVDHLPFKGSKSLLTQMLLALVSNGVRAAGKGGEVEMKFHAENGRCVISVRDTGVGIPEDRIEELAATACNTTTCFMPYINAFFQPRKESDRPKVVPDGAVNFAFIGQFAETPRDTIFTTEYSMRTGMEAVYTLLNVDRGVPEVWGSVYDVRDLLNATVKLRDGKKATDMDLSFGEKMVLKKALSKIGGTDVEKLLKQYGVI